MADKYHDRFEPRAVINDVFRQVNILSDSNRMINRESVTSTKNSVYQLEK